MEIGQYVDAIAYRETEYGWFLMDESATEVLLPNKFVPEGIKQGDEIKVFIYLDNEERLTATTQQPKIELNGFALLEVKDVNRVGAFVDWGLDKQLLVPYSEQTVELKVDRKHVVYLKKDRVTDRLIGSTKISKYLDNTDLTVSEGDEVDLIVFSRSDLGYNLVINKKHRGLIFENRIFRKLRVGDELKGYILKIDEENKIDIVLEPQGYKNAIEPNSQKILDYLEENDGYMPYNDKSDPEDIKMVFQMSKKNFKKALGGLYREKMVRIEDDGVYKN